MLNTPIQSRPQTKKAQSRPEVINLNATNEEKREEDTIRPRLYAQEEILLQTREDTREGAQEPTTVVCQAALQDLSSNKAELEHDSTQHKELCCSTPTTTTNPH